MEQLPVELLVNIFSHFHFKEKLELMTVSPQWYQILFVQGYLFESLELSVSSSFEAFDQRVNVLIRHAEAPVEPVYASKGHRCSRLLIDSPLHGNNQFNIGNLAVVFPNLNYLEFRTEMNFIQDNQNIAQLQGWRNTLNTLLDSSLTEPMDNISVRILNTGVFNRLTSLRCYLGNTPNDLLFTALPNAPNLTTLAIKVDTIVLHSLETLSNLIPNVNSLTLEIQLQHGVRQLTVVPIRDEFVIAINQHVRAFKIITSTQYLGRFDLLLTYLQVKYPNLTQLVYSEAGTPSNQVTPFHGPSWQSLLEARNNTMETLVLGRLRKSNHLVRAATEQVFPELRHLELVLYNDRNLYQTVITHGWRNRLTTLALSEVPSNQDFDFLSLFTHLQKVHLAYKAPRIGMEVATIEDILNAFPATTVSLSLENLVINVNFGAINRPSNVLDLKLKLCGFTGPIISQFLTACIPNLTSLTLDYCISYGDLDLPNHDLEEFKCTVPPPMFQPYVGGGALPPSVFRITCRSIREAYYCGYLLLLFN